MHLPTHTLGRLALAAALACFVGVAVPADAQTLKDMGKAVKKGQQEEKQKKAEGRQRNAEAPTQHRLTRGSVTFDILKCDRGEEGRTRCTLRLQNSGDDITVSVQNMGGIESDVGTRLFDAKGRSYPSKIVRLVNKRKEEGGWVTHQVVRDVPVELVIAFAGVPAGMNHASLVEVMIGGDLGRSTLKFRNIRVRGGT